MANFQFLHLNTYGQTTRRGEKRHATAVGILNEGGRLPSASGHLANPKPPRLLFGAPPQTFIGAVKTLFERAKDSRGRKLRNDGGVLVAMVISYPVPRLSICTETILATYEKWKAATLAWLSERFQTTLKCVVEHADEEHLHLHAFLLPSLLRDGQISWSECHPGLAARHQAAFQGLDKTAQNFEYVRAMRALQDEFYHLISAKFGHHRTGPLRQRRRREEHLAVSNLEKQLAQARSMIASLQAELAEYNQETLLNRRSTTQESEMPFQVEADVATTRVKPRLDVSSLLPIPPFAAINDVPSLYADARKIEIGLALKGKVCPDDKCIENQEGSNWNEVAESDHGYDPWINPAYSPQGTQYRPAGHDEDKRHDHDIDIELTDLLTEPDNTLVP